LVSKKSRVKNNKRDDRTYSRATWHYGTNPNSTRTNWSEGEKKKSNDSPPFAAAQRYERQTNKNGKREKGEENDEFESRNDGGGSRRRFNSERGRRSEESLPSGISDPFLPGRK